MHDKNIGKHAENKTHSNNDEAIDMSGAHNENLFGSACAVLTIKRKSKVALLFNGYTSNTITII